jgi:hypothetical protein
MMMMMLLSLLLVKGGGADKERRSGQRRQNTNGIFGGFQGSKRREISIVIQRGERREGVCGRV